jgi:hypothetical protein
MGNHAAWNGTITALRLDPVNNVNVTFEIDWIKSVCTNCTGARTSTQSLAKSQPTNPVRMYPNPLGKKLFVRGVSKGVLVSIFDMQGKLRKELAYTAEGIDVTDLEAGTYLVKVNDKSYRVIKSE